MGLSENTFYRLSGICGIVAIVFDLPMLWIFGFGAADACIFIAGGLAIAALFTENKGVLIGAMVLAIIAAILCAVLAATYVFVASICIGLDGLGEAFCNSEHDDREGQSGCDRTADSHTCGTATCCFGCQDTASCGASGCEWTPTYIVRECQCTCEEPDEAACASDTNPDCKCTGVYDETSCLASGGVGKNKNGFASWDCFTYTQKASCGQGIDLSGQRYARTDVDASCTACGGTTFTGKLGESGPKCPSTLGQVDCKGRSMESVDGGAWINTGCEAPDAADLVDDTDNTDADNEFQKFCDYKGLATFLVFANMIVCIIIAIGGCCVTCCGKGPDAGGDDDDGKSDE